MPLCNVVNQSICLVEQVLANSGKVNDCLDSEALQQSPIADPGEF